MAININGYDTQEGSDNADGARQFNEYSTKLPPPFPWDSAEDGGLYAVFNSRHGFASWIKIPYPTEEIKIDNKAIARTNAGWFQVTNQNPGGGPGHLYSHDVAADWWTIEQATQHTDIQIIQDPLRTNNNIIRVQNTHTSKCSYTFTTGTTGTSWIHNNTEQRDESHNFTCYTALKKDPNLAWASADVSVGGPSVSFELNPNEYMYLTLAAYNWASSNTNWLNMLWNAGVSSLIEHVE